MTESRRIRPITRKSKGVHSYRHPEKSLRFFLELEERRAQQMAEAISWLNEIFGIQ